MLHTVYELRIGKSDHTYINKSRQRCCDSEILFNKFSIKIGEPKKGLHVFYTSRCLLLHDNFNLFKIHLQTLRCDDQV